VKADCLETHRNRAAVSELHITGFSTLQKNGQASLQLDPLALPGEYNQTTISLPQQEWVLVLESITSPELRKTLEAAVTRIEPNKELLREHLQSGREVAGASLVKGEHVRFD
jgi:hypothetical protein